MENVGREVQTGPKDVFLHLLSIITLYVSVVFAGNLLFQFANIYLPDSLLGETARYARAALRWPLSVLVVVFPLYVWVSSYIQRELLRFPEKRELKTRKWLMYLTLFLATCVIAGDVVSLVFTYLNGEITLRFILKIVIVLYLAVSVFVYYIWNLRHAAPAMQDRRMKYFVWTVLLLTTTSIVFGFYAAGSPQSERLRRFDDQRIYDLQSIQYEIVQFWQAKEVLPASLDDLRDEIRGYIPPIDPKSSAPYEYRSTNALSFELCASFSASSKEDNSDPLWTHGAGRACFERTIDTELYQPTRKRPY